MSANFFCPHCGAANPSGNAVCSVCAYTFISAPSAPTGSLKGHTLLKQRYQVITKVGQGGFAAVYQARDLQLRSALRAIKEMSTQQLDQGEIQKAITAFEQEAHLLARLMHPNFPRIYDHFEEQQRWYLVLDYIDGQTLSQALANSPQRKLPAEMVIEYALQLCSALSYLHTQTPPIIFRDLKPANIMTTPEHHIYLIDFGIARFFKPGQAKDTIALGSVGYAPPEQFGRAQTTPQADIYGLGATLHHLLSGRDPSDEPFVFPPLDLEPHNAMTRGFANLITRMVAIKKEERPTSVQEIQRTLSALQQISQSRQSTIIVPARQQSSNALPASQPRKPQAIVPMHPPTINPPITRLFRFTRRGTKKWSFPTHIGNRRVPLIINDIVYISAHPTKSSKALYALNADFGLRIWSFPIDDLVPPLVGNGNVVCIRFGDCLYGLHASSGQRLWSFVKQRHSFRNSHLLMEGNVIYAWSSNALFALDAASGQELWSFSPRYFPSWRSPLPFVVVDGVLYVNSEKSICALDAASGQEVWSFQTQNEITGSPIVVDGTVYCITNNRVSIIDALSGQENGWVLPFYHPTWPLVANGIIYLGSNHNLYALDALSGRQLWAFPVRHTNRVPLTVVDGIVYMGSHDHKLYALDATSGQQLWAFQTRGAVDSPSTMQNGVIYFGSKDTNLYALNATSGQYLWSFSEWRSPYRNRNIMEWSAPFVQDGVVYVTCTGGELYAIFA